MLVALGAQHAKRMRHIVIRGLTGFTKCFHILLNGTIFEKKKIIEHKMCSDLLYKFCLQHFSL